MKGSAFNHGDIALNTPVLRYQTAELISNKILTRIAFLESHIQIPLGVSTFAMDKLNACCLFICFFSFDARHVHEEEGKFMLHI